MTWSVQGLVSLSPGQPAQLMPVQVPTPRGRDVVVDVSASGVCHTDLAYRDGDINDDFPFLLGHEAAGRVAAVGEDVTHVQVGDMVVLNWRAVCGQCRACKKGVPQYCFDTYNASEPMRLEDGTALTPALGIGAFIEKTLVHELQCTKVNPEADPAAVGLLGCGVMAGIGAVLNTGEVKRGESVAVIGLGGVGLAAIAGAALGGATTIIALDLDERKFAAARELGATHTIDTTGLEPDAVAERIRDLTGGFGADLVIDAVALPATYTAAFYGRDLAGRVVLVGVPTPTREITLPLIDVFGRGGALKSSWYGDCLPERDFPALTDLYLQGRLPLDSFVSERITVDQVEDAFVKMSTGEVVRSVVEYSAAKDSA